MAVTVQSPTNRVVPRSGTTRFSWTTSYPQSAYEIQYRPVAATAWSTFGRVTSSSKSVDLNISNLTDFVEYHFRIVVYASNASSGTTIYDGNEKSAVYSLIVSPPGQLARLRGKYGDKILEVPIYEQTNAPESVHVQIAKGGKKGVMPLASLEETTATPLHVKHPANGRAFAEAAAPKFTYSATPSETYMRVDSRKTHYRYYYRYAYASYYVANYLSSYSTKYNSYNRGNYLTGYTEKYDRTYYRGYYFIGYINKLESYTAGNYLSGYGFAYDYNSYVVSYSSTSYQCNYSYISGYTAPRPAYGNQSGYYRCYTNDGHFGGTCHYSYTYLLNNKYPDPIWSYSTGICYQSTPYYGYYRYQYSGAIYSQYYRYRYYTIANYQRYYGYYRYTYGVYAAYYGYYTYYSPNYSPYYSYYRFTTSYKQTYYSYSRAYRYS